ncbi:LacI family DNA-binding transcriptional regulator [Bacillus gobiensis]|uniref:LacI family DNA-binding transcriptional regulator n=1 Tax=Bacillus gobiensis TaxID=1441095 RepID=UPI003D1BE11A
MENKKKITITDVADKAGVSKSTVSQYLNKRYQYMSSETKNKIAKVIEELNFRPNDNARNLKVKKTKVVGIVLANLLHHLSTEIVRVVEERLQSHEIKVFICNSDDSPKKESDYIDLLISKQVDGIIIFPVGNDPKVYNYVISYGIPLVFIDRIVDGVMTDCILLDNKAACRLAVSQLQNKGHENIAFLTLPTDIPVSTRRERIEGFKEAMSFYHLEVQENNVFSVPREEIQGVLEQRFLQENKPTAIVAGNDLVLREVLSFINKVSLSMPNDLALVSIDEVTYSNLYNPSITTVNQPIKEMGEKTADILLDRINVKTDDPFRVYRFTPELIIRGSC